MHQLASLSFTYQILHSRPHKVVNAGPKDHYDRAACLRDPAVNSGLQHTSIHLHGRGFHLPGKQSKLHNAWRNLALPADPDASLCSRPWFCAAAAEGQTRLCSGEGPPSRRRSFSQSAVWRPRVRFGHPNATHPKSERRLDSWRTAPHWQCSRALLLLQCRDSPAHSRNASHACLLYTSPSPRDRTRSRMPSSA